MKVLTIFCLLGQISTIWSDADALWDKLPGAANANHHVSQQQQLQQKKPVFTPSKQIVKNGGASSFWGTLAGEEPSSENMGYSPMTKLVNPMANFGPAMQEFKTTVNNRRSSSDFTSNNHKIIAKFTNDRVMHRLAQQLFNTKKMKKPHGDIHISIF
jgi:hypothetical protein